MTYDNTLVGATLTGTNDADSITNKGASATIAGGGDSDSIDNYASSVSIDGGADNDYLQNWDWDNKYVTVRGGDGNDTIRNVGSYSTIDGGAGDDSIRNWSNLVSIDGGAGNDEIHNSNYYATGNSITIDGGLGNDSIVNFGNNLTILGGDGDDTLFSYGGYSSKIDGGNGNDRILNGWITDSSVYGTNATLIGGEGNDSFANWSDSVTIDAGTGDDTINNNGGYNVSISGGTGNDSINLSSNAENNVIVFSANDGNDTVIGFNETDTLKIGEDGKGVYSTQISGDDIVATVADDKGKITLRGAATLEAVNIEGILSNVVVNRDSNTTVRGTSDTLNPDAIYNHGHDVTIQALGGNDTILNYGVAPNVTNNSAGSNVSINAGNGNDSIRNNGRYSVLDGGDGNDSITNTSWGISSTILGGAGDDIAYNWSDNITISSSTGDDFIWNDAINGGANSVLADGGAGNDTITSWGNDSTLIGGEGDDNITNYTNGYSNGKLVVEGVGKNVSISGGEGNDSIDNRGASVSIDGGAGNDSIQNFGDGTSICGGEGDDSIHNGNYASIGVQNAFIDGSAGNDMIVNNGSNMTISGGAGNDYVSINYSESLNYGSNILLLYTEGDDTIRGINETDTLRLGDGTATYSKKTIGNDVFLTTGNGVIKLEGVATLESLNIIGKLVNQNGGNTINNTVSSVSVTGTAYDDTITNSGSNVTIDARAGNDSISLGAGATNNLLVYTQSNGSDTVSGFKANSTVSIASNAEYTKDSLDNDVIISLNGGDIVLKDAASLSANVNIKGGTLIPNDGVEIDNKYKKYTLNGTDARDTLINHAGGATILGGKGNDSIYNSTEADYKVEAGLGYVTIDGGDGNDTIFSYDPNVSISGGDNADVISLKSSNFSGVTINAGKGNDTIYGNGNNYGVLYEFRAGDGNDEIINFGSNDTLSISGGSYTREVDANNNVLVSVEGGGIITLRGAGDKEIYIYPTNGETGKYINNSNNNITLSGSSVADTIKNYGDNVTINGWSGNDTIYNNCGDDTSINAGNGNDSIDGNNNRVTINGGTGKDTITGNHWGSKLSGDGDDDLISITTYWYNTLDGGAGNDSIIAGGSEHSVNGGADADVISLSGDKLTVAGGTGDDTIYGNTATSHLYAYAKGDGNDIIYNYGSNDSITISGSTWTTLTSGSNVIVEVANSGNITLDGAKGKTLNIYPNTKPTVASGVTAQDVIKKFMGSLDTTAYAGKAALDQAVSVASGGYFANVSAAIQQMTLDCANATDADTFLREKCGIILGNDDTGAITGSDAGGSSVKTAQNVVDESNKEELDSSFIEDTFTTNGLTVKLGDIPYDGNYVYYPRDLSFGSLQNSTKEYIWQAYKTWWVEGALDLIEESYGDNYGFGINSSATTHTLYFGFFNKSPSNGGITLAWTAKPGNVLAMAVNMSAYGSLEGGGNPDGKRNSRDTAYLDRTLAHEMTHAVMKANVNYFNDLPQFITEGLAELTHGADDDRRPSIENLASAENIAYLINSLSFNPGTGTIAVGNDLTDAYAGGYMFLRYFAKQAAEHYPTTSNADNISGNFSISRSEIDSDAITVAGKLMTIAKDLSDDKIDLTAYASVNNLDATALAKGIEITGNTNANSIKTGVGNDTVFSNVGNDTLIGGAGDDVLYGEAGNDKIDGEAGDDTLSGGTGTNTLTGGAGKDLFVHVADNDIITDYKSGEDTIQLVEGRIIDASLSGSNVVLDVGMYGSITVQNGADKEIIIIDGDGNQSTIKPQPKVLTLTDSDAAKVTMASAYISADASARTQAINIMGNAKDNSIIGGKTADTLAGGAGNDTLTGGWKGDVFIYTADNDVITDYNQVAGDKVSIAGDGAKYLSHITGVQTSGSDVTLTFSKDSNKTLTLNGAAGKKVVINDATRIFNNNTISTGDKKYATLTSGFSGTFNANGYKSVNASAVTQAVKISGANSIVGGAKADSITGTTGNDTLTGGYGADTFIYTGGKDVITDYTANFDRVSLAGGNNAKWLSHITGVAVKNKNVTLTFGNDANKTLTLNNAAGKKVIINGATRIFENGKIYTADKKSATVASAADAYWFDEHDFTQGAQLDSIVDSASDYSLGKLDASNALTKLMQDEFILAFGDK